MNGWFIPWVVFVWLGWTAQNALRHDSSWVIYDGKPQKEGCYFLWRGPLTAWPLHRTKDILCWQNSGIQERGTP